MKKSTLRLIIITVILILVIVGGCFLLKSLFNKNQESNKKVEPLNTKLNMDVVFSSLEKLYNNELDLYEEERSGELIETMPEEQGTSGNEFEVEEPEVIITDDGKIHAISGDELNEYLNSEELNGLIRKAIIKTDDDIVDEVWIVKLNDKESQEKVARILGNRIRKLKDGFKENKTELMVIESSEIKQENDVVIMIASPNKESIENIIAKEMTKE